MSDDAYCIVSGRLKGVRPNVIFIEHRRHKKELMVTRSLMHGADDLKIERAKIGDEFTFRLREWKAEELGL